MNLKSKVMESIRWLAISQLLTQVIRLSVSIYVIRQLESEHMAYIALSETITSFLGMFSTLGLGAVVISRKDITEIELSNIAGMALLIQAVLGLSLIGISGIVADFYNTPALANILRVMSFGFLVTALAAIPSALMTKAMRFKELSAIQFIAGILGAITSFVLVNLGFEYWSIVIGGLTFISTSAVMVIVVSGGIVMPRFNIVDSMRFVNFGGFVMLSGIVWYVYTSADVIIAGRVWSPETLGIYAVAVQLTVMPLNRLMPVLKQVALPAFSRTVAEDRARLQDYIGKSLRISMSICVPLFFGISAVATLLVPLILGSKWTGSALPLIFLCAAAPFRIFLELLSPAIIATGNPKYLLKNSMVIALVMIASFIIAANVSSEPVALSLVWVLVYPTIAVLSSRGHCKIMGVEFRAVMVSISKPIIHSVIMWVGVMFYIEFAASYISSLVLLVSSVIIGILLYVLLIVLFDRALFIEIGELIRKN